MALEAFLNLNKELSMPIMLPVAAVNEDGGLFEAVRSLGNEHHPDSIINMSQLNSNSSAADIMHSAILGNASASGYSNFHNDVFALCNMSLPPGANLQTHGHINTEPYVTLPSPPISFSRNHPMNNSSTAEVFSQLTRKRKRVEKPTASIDVPKLDSQNCRDSLNVRIKQEPGTLSPFLKKTRCDANQENISQQQQQHKITQELLLKELEARDLQLNIMVNQLKQPVLHSTPEFRGLQLQLPESLMRNLMRDHVVQQIYFPSLLDGGICSRRVMQYLYHLHNRPRDNNIAYWKKFVSEYYAPGSKKRWCFSLYQNIESRATGVFCPKSMEKLCCELCGSRSVKALEATFEVFPRLFKLKFEGGIVNEILYLDPPIVWKLPSGLLVVEYSKAVQVSVYETFRVVHEGKLRIVFGIDLKILSWEFCTQKHEEFLLRRVLAPQVNELLQGAQKFIRNNSLPVRFSSEDLQRNCNTMASAAQNIVKDIELQLVNGLGYPKRFVRCLQISEIVNSMKDLMASSRVRKIGPIESLNNYSEGSKISNQTKIRGTTDYGVGSNLVSANFGNQLHGQNTFVASASEQEPLSCLMERSNQSIYSLPQSFHSQFSEHSKNPNQALIDKLLHEMVVASKGKSGQDTSGKPNKEITHKSNQNTFRSLLGGPTGNPTNSKMGIGQPSDASRTGNLPKSSSHGNSSAVTCNITVKTEPVSPDITPEAFGSLAAGFSKIEDFEW